MTQENKDRLLSLLQQYQELGIAEQIDFDKSITDSLIANSIALVDFQINQGRPIIIHDMAKRREIRNSTAEFPIFQIEGKEELK